MTRHIILLWFMQHPSFATAEAPYSDSVHSAARCSAQLSTTPPAQIYTRGHYQTPRTTPHTLTITPASIIISYVSTFFCRAEREPLSFSDGNLPEFLSLHTALRYVPSRIHNARRREAILHVGGVSTKPAISLISCFASKERVAKSREGETIRVAGSCSRMKWAISWAMSEA